jgi:hypothetical protein
MALADRKPVDRHKITDNTKLARISQSFEAGKHLELEAYDGEAAMIYQMQELTDDVKEIHRYLGSEVTTNSATNLSATANGTSLSINSSDGDNVSLPAATTDAWGVMTDEMFDKLDGIAASSNNYVHPNHSGEVTSNADGATVIADNIVDEANLKVSNTPTDGYVLTAQSGNTGGLTWAEASSGGGEPGGSVYDNTIKLLLTDFRSNDDANLERVMLEDDTSNNLSIRIGSTSIEMYATIPLPKGKKVTHMHIYASATLTCNSYEVNLTTGARTSKATGNSNTTIPFNDGRTNREFNSTATNYLAIRVNTTSTSQKLYGGIITIADI